MDPIVLDPIVAASIGAAITAGFGWLTKYHLSVVDKKDAMIEKYKEKMEAVYAEGRAKEDILETTIETKNRRIRDTERRLSWFEAKHGNDIEPPEINRTSIN